MQIGLLNVQWLNRRWTPFFIRVKRHCFDFVLGAYTFHRHDAFTSAFRVYIGRGYRFGRDNYKDFNIVLQLFGREIIFKVGL